MRKIMALLACLLLAGSPAAAQGRAAPEQSLIPIDQIPNYRQQMRDIIEVLAAYAKSRNQNFILLSRGGFALFAKSKREIQLENLKDPEGTEAYRRLPLGTLVRPYFRSLAGYVEDDRTCGAAALAEEARLKVEAEIAEKGRAEEKIKEDTAARQKEKYVIRGRWTRVVVDPNLPPPAPPPPVNTLVAEAELAQARIVAELAEAERTAEQRLLASVKNQGLHSLSIEHCRSTDLVNKAMRLGSKDHVLTFADIDQKGELDRISKGRPWSENSANVDSLDEAKNMLVMVDSRHYARRDEWLLALSKSNHDLLIIDGFHKGNESLTKNEVHDLKFKRLGARRLVLARLNLGEAQDYRYYWQKDWIIGTPAWLEAPSPHDPAAMIVKYWDDEWKKIIGKYMAGLMDLGFDGVMLEGLNTYEHFEKLTPLE